MRELFDSCDNDDDLLDDEEVAAERARQRARRLLDDLDGGDFDYLEAA